MQRLGKTISNICMDQSYSELNEYAPNGSDSWVWDVEGGAVKVSGPLCKKFCAKECARLSMERLEELLGRECLRRLTEGLAPLLDGARESYETVLGPVSDQCAAPLFLRAAALERDGNRRALKLFGVVHPIRDTGSDSKPEHQDSIWRLFLEEAPIGAFHSTIGGEILWVNQAYAKIFGFTDPQEVLRSINDVASDLYADPSKRRRIVDLAIEKDQLINFENEYKRADGAGFVGNLSLRAMRDENGHVYQLQGFVFDITERKQAEEALRRSEERVRSFIDSVDDMVYFQGIDGSLSLLNKANEKITGYTIEEFYENPQLWREIIHPEDVAFAEKFFEENPEGVPYFEAEYRIKSKSGQWKTIHSRMFASRDRHGAIIGYHCLDRDVTELKRAEELVVQTERLKAVAELATGVAHNFNNLLQILMSAAQMAGFNLETGAHNELKNNLDQIMQSSKLGVDTVKRLQEFARLRTDLSFDDATICDLASLVEQAVDMTRPWRKRRTEKRTYLINLESDLERDCHIKCIESEIFEVLVNLLKNSCEAIQRGGAIRVATRKIGGSAVLTISDTGEGLTEEETEQIFEPFWSKKGIKGAGMGLPMSRGTIVRHGGAIEAHSPGPGMGATFQVTLPLVTPPQGADEEATEKRGFPSLGLLLIDDIQPVLMMLKDNLEKFGQRVIGATSGAEGLEKLKSEEVDLIICDYAMPGMDGLMVASASRDLYEARGMERVPFILITGWGGELPSNEELRKMGVDALLEKPIDMDILLEKAVELVDAGTSP